MYTLIVWSIGLPVPAVTQFENIHKEVTEYKEALKPFSFYFWQNEEEIDPGSELENDEENQTLV